MFASFARRRVVIAGLLALLAACDRAERTSDRASDRATDRMSDVASATLFAKVGRGAISAPDSISSGWTRVHIEELEDTHIVVVFRLPATTTFAEQAAFVSALDAAPGTPEPGVAIGGPEVGSRGDVIVNLTPGVYVLACVRRGEDGHRHAIAGESRMLRVTARPSADSSLTASLHTATPVRMVDFAYVGEEHWNAGAQLLRIENTGAQDHQLRLARLRDGATLQSWINADNPDTVATTVAGMARVGPGQVAYLPVELSAGTYIAYCLVADATSKRPHVELGMLRAIRVP